LLVVTTFPLKKTAFAFFRRIIAVGRPQTVDDDDDDAEAEADPSFRVVAKAKVVGTRHPDALWDWIVFLHV